MTALDNRETIVKSVLAYGDAMPPPRYEIDVLLRFLNIATWRYGFRIISVRPNVSPDIIALRGRRHIGIEVELRSSSFRYHVARKQHADVVVCWEHDWPDCPVDEVIELRTEPLGGEFSFDEDDFYYYANHLLDGRRSDRIDFSTTTPALLLVSERYTPNRREYAERLHRAMLTKSGRLSGRYLFLYSKTFRGLTQLPEGRPKVELRKVRRLMADGNLVVNANLGRPFPSGLLGEIGGAEVLKSPITGESVAVQFFSGIALQVKRRLYEELWRRTLPPEDWYKNFHKALIETTKG